MLTMPVLSTAHITLQTRDALMAMANAVRRVPGVIRVAEYEEGFFVHFNTVEADNMPPDLWAIRAWAAPVWQWVRIDRDGDAVPTLVQYEW